MATLQLISAGAGILVSLLAVLSRRLGPGSPLLAAFTLPAAVAVGLVGATGLVEGTDELSCLRLAFALLVVSAPGGLAFSLTATREDCLEALKRRAAPLGALYALALTFLTATCLAPAPIQVEGRAVELLPLGPPGYIAGLYLLAVSVLVLASLERTLRSAEEHVRWEIKFLVLGLYASFATLIYLASRMLLYPFRECVLPRDALHVFPWIFLPSTVLMAVSWRRSSGKSRVVVSQGLVYGSVTLVGVGVFLIASSLLAQWAGSLVEASIETEVVVFLLSAVLFSALLFSARFRHRVRYWIRRNLFAGAYDYRTFWLEATEKVRSSDTLEEAASALADLIAKALGSLDVAVWARDAEGGKPRLLAVRGCTGGPPPAELPPGLAQKLRELPETVSAEDLVRRAGPDLDRAFLRRTSAALAVPLRSGGEAIGLVTVGADRSGRPFDWEAAEFLRVLAAHAAGEIHKRELIASQVAAKEAEVFRSFSTFLLHDLKNFASTLSLIAQNAARHQGNPDFQRDAFGSVYETAEKMKRLCNSLRTFSGVIAPRKGLADLNGVVGEVTRSLDAPASSRLRVDLGPLPLVLIDEDDVARVLQNLILNASEAIGPEGSVTVRTVCRDGEVSLSVSDDGKGIPREFLEKELFLPFRTTKASGLGIGLYQSKRIMEAHGGTIRVESQEGKGTTVTVTFPVPEARG
ncbi:MAG: PEP-CTERM system histidine kinase PrsK [Planctomycetes bacterium]|nr:PEP-CTERM system histidine kinase PrsK [Planctomycetota bacterium]